MTVSTSHWPAFIAAIVTMAGCTAIPPTKPSANFVSQFSEISPEKFTIRVDAPPALVREFAICKAVWFTEQQHKASLSLTNPKYSTPNSVVPGTAPAPAGWTRLTTVAYFNAPNPDGNPSMKVADKAPGCRALFDWYH